MGRRTCANASAFSFDAQPAQSVRLVRRIRLPDDWLEKLSMVLYLCEMYQPKLQLIINLWQGDYGEGVAGGVSIRVGVGVIVGVGTKSSDTGGFKVGRGKSKGTSFGRSIDWILGDSLFMYV